MSKIVVMYRVKNEERWIEQSIKSVYDFCDEIVIFDDNSTDNTKKICTQFDKVVEIHSKTDSTFDESRDRNLLLNMALKRKPDVLLSLDGDEIFLPGSGKIIGEEIDILQYIEHLNKQAQKKHDDPSLDLNSAFITLIGNHELMNILGDFRYVSTKTTGNCDGHL